MLFSRIPRPGQLVELLVIFLVCWWVFHNPAGAGHFVGHIIHFLTSVLPAQASTFFSNI